LLCVALAAAGLGAAGAAGAAAHPLGNFTVNYASSISVSPQAIDVSVVVDRAEIPTIQALPDASVGHEPTGAPQWVASECADLAGSARLSVDGHVETLAVGATRLQILAGAAGLATSRLECSLHATITSGLPVGARVSYQAPSTAGRVGWHEVTAAGVGMSLVGSDVPVVSPSQELSSYPTDLLASPLDQRSATFTIAAGGAAASTATRPGLLASGPLRGLDGLTTAYTDLVSRTDLTPGFAVLAVFLAMLLGALHAFAPGHGKTLMAAYLVGRTGTWRQAAVIGASVTVTHTVGVLVLGVALSAAALAAPEQAYSWLGLVSGILLTGIGVTLLRSARRGHVHGPGGHTHGPGGHTHQEGPHDPHHDHSGLEHHHDQSEHGHSGYDHSGHLPLTAGGLQLATLTAADPNGSATHGHHHAHDHAHPQKHQHVHGHQPLEVVPTGRGSGPLRHWRVAAVGLVGGMVPSPSALLVLLGGIAVGRAWFGVLLVVVYGLGMATALVGTGLLLVLARDRFERWSALRPERLGIPGMDLARQLSRQIPLLAAVVVIGLGLWIAIRSFPL
ncbi:MAG: hypothetical protein ABJA89_15640, partial [Lapillicoccus sp.]